ncbi:MAG: WYL domain-containing protein, partial [Clostridia bacterium]|nr:WYL domain-containing protein [Clostridia bacterium]
LCDNMTTRYFIPANTNAEDKLVYIADEDMKTEEKYLDSRLYGIIQDAYDNALSYSYPNRNGIPVRFENVRTGRIIRSGGFYYLLGYTDITTAFAHRIDMISNYEKKQAPWDFRYFKWMKNDGLLPTIAASLPCERVEEPVELVLSADGRGAMKIRDRFGNLAVRYSADGDGSSLFKITLMPEAAARFAAEWCDCVTVKAPLSIAARVREILTNAKAKYD